MPRSRCTRPRTTVGAVAVAVAVAALSVPAASGQTPPLSEEELRSLSEKAQLYNACRPMALVIESMPENSAKIGLSEQSLRDLAERRLRAARLYDENSGNSALYVRVSVEGGAFAINVHYRKIVIDAASSIRFAAVTWETGGVGTAPADGANFVTAGLSRFLDEFLIEYLRVNAAACP